MDRKKYKEQVTLGNKVGAVIAATPHNADAEARTEVAGCGSGSAAQFAGAIGR